MRRESFVLRSYRSDLRCQPQKKKNQGAGLRAIPGGEKREIEVGPARLEEGSIETKGGWERNRETTADCDGGRRRGRGGFRFTTEGRRAFYTRSGREGQRPKRRDGGRGVKEAFGWRIGKQEFGECRSNGQERSGVDGRAGWPRDLSQASAGRH